MTGSPTPREGVSTSDVVDLDDAEEVDNQEDADQRRKTIENDARESYAKVARWAMVGQVFTADAIFVAYAWAGRSWNVEPGVMIAFLSSTVVQVIGVFLVITKSLFPPDR